MVWIDSHCTRFYHENERERKCKYSNSIMCDVVCINGFCLNECKITKEIGYFVNERLLHMRYCHGIYYTLKMQMKLILDNHCSLQHYFISYLSVRSFYYF